MMMWWFFCSFLVSFVYPLAIQSKWFDVTNEKCVRWRALLVVVDEILKWIFISDKFKLTTNFDLFLFQRFNSNWNCLNFFHYEFDAVNFFCHLEIISIFSLKVRFHQIWIQELNNSYWILSLFSKMSTLKVLYWQKNLFEKPHSSFILSFIYLALPILLQACLHNIFLLLPYKKKEIFKNHLFHILETKIAFFLCVLYIFKYVTSMKKFISHAHTMTKFCLPFVQKKNYVELRAYFSSFFIYASHVYFVVFFLFTQSLLSPFILIFINMYLGSSRGV